MHAQPTSLTRRAVVIGLALFAMFFGAGNLIFPPYLGMQAGTSWWIGFIAFFLADVGLAFTTIIVMTQGDGTISGVTGVIGKRLSFLLNTAVILCIGPLLAIPRTAATTYEMTILPLINGNPTSMGALITSVVFFGIVLFLSLRATKVVDLVGKYLTPLIVGILLLMITVGIVWPLGTVAPPAIDTVVKEGIINGYQAMDVLGALGFAIIIISAIAQSGIRTRKERNQVMWLACGIAGAILAVVYGGICYLGATASSVYDVSTVNQAGLIVSITRDLLGGRGVILLGLMVGLACLTTAIGLTSAAAHYFDQVSGGKIRYQIVVFVVVLFSLIVSNFGLSTIIQVAVPILTLVYPVVVTLVVLRLFKRRIHNDRIYKGAALMTLLTSICSILYTYKLGCGFVQSFPFADFGFEWVVPMLIGAVAGGLLPRKKEPVS